MSGQTWAGAGFLTGNLVLWVGLAAAFVTTFYMARACFLIFWGETRSHHEPHESGKQILVPLTLLAVLSIGIGYIGSPAWPAGLPHFESWTATPVLEAATYPFLAEGGEILHGPPAWHLDLLTIAFGVFLVGLVLAWRVYGRGMPDRDPTLHMGALTTALENRYGFDDLGYRYVVVPVRDELALLAAWSNNIVIDGLVGGAGRATKRLAATTYRVLDQRVIDGGVNGTAFSAAWWSDRLKRTQSGNVQRYAAALVAGVIVLVLAFAGVR